MLEKLRDILKGFGNVQRRKPTSIEARAYNVGTGNIPLESFLQQINATFDGKQAETEMAYDARTKKFEGQTSIYEQYKREVQTVWNRLEMETNGIAPSWIAPLMGLFFVVLLLSGETWLLAPQMDAWGIPDSIGQFLTAGVLVLGLSLLFKICVSLFKTLLPSVAQDASEDEKAKTKRERRSLIAYCGFFSMLVLLSTITIGWLRGSSIVLANQAQGGLLGFIARNTSFLMKFAVTLATIFLPLIAAVISDWSFKKLRYAWECAKTRLAWRYYTHRYYTKQKELEAALAEKEHALNGLNAQRKEWLAIAKHAHEEGSRIGAHQLPLWDVSLKILGFFFMALIVCLIVCHVFFDSTLAQFVTDETLRTILYVMLAVAFTFFYTQHALRSWYRPTSEQLVRPTIWRVSAFGAKEKPVATVRSQNEQVQFEEPTKKSLPDPSQNGSQAK